MRENVGYEIIQSIKTGEHEEIVIGHHPKAAAPYVCWDCLNGDNYFNGGYTLNYRQALLVMSERIHNRYDSLPVDL